MSKSSHWVRSIRHHDQFQAHYIVAESRNATSILYSITFANTDAALQRYIMP